MTKATSWFANSTLPSASTICTSPARVGIQASLTGFSSSAVSTAIHAGQCRGLADVDLLDPRMAVGRAHEIAVQHAGQFQVVDIVALALDEAGVFGAAAGKAHALEGGLALGAGRDGRVHSAASFFFRPAMVSAAALIAFTMFW